MSASASAAVRLGDRDSSEGVFTSADISCPEVVLCAQGWLIQQTYTFQLASHRPFLRAIADFPTALCPPELIAQKGTYGSHPEVDDLPLGPPDVLAGAIAEHPIVCADS